MKRHEAHEKHEENQEDSQLGLLLSLVVVAAGVPERLQDFDSDAHVAKHNQDADEPEENVHRQNYVLVKSHASRTLQRQTEIICRVGGMAVS